MKLDDLTTPPRRYEDIAAPRARAAQDTAATNRAKLTEDDAQPVAKKARRTIPPQVIIAGGMLLVLALAAVLWPQSRPVQFAPTANPLPTVAAPAVVVATPAPTATDVPTAAPSPEPQTGQGLTLIEDVAPPAPTDVPAVPTWDATAFAVSQQATHVTIFQTAAANGLPQGVIPATPVGGVTK